MFLLASSLAFMIKYVNDETLELMDYIAMVTSFISTIKTVYHMVILRYKE